MKLVEKTLLPTDLLCHIRARRYDDEVKYAGHRYISRDPTRTGT